MTWGTTRARILTAALTTTLTLPLAACTHNDPATPPPTSTSASPATPTTPTPSATLPDPPGAQHTQAGAEAFARYFWDLYNYTFATLDTAPLRAISDPACKFCGSTNDYIADLQANGRHSEGGAVTVSAAISPDPKDLEDPDRVVVIGVVDQDAGRILNADGSLKTTSKPIVKAHADIGLLWQNDAWRVRGVVIDTKAAK